MPAVGPGHDAALSSMSSTLREFIEKCPPQIERALALFRRASDPSFLSDTTRTRLAYAALESMLGRFSDPTRALPLEELVTRLMRDRHGEATRWVNNSGRRRSKLETHSPPVD